MRLFPKLLLSFFAIILTGVLAVSYLANQAAAREVQAFMFQGGMATDAGLAQQLAGYYRGHGSWEGAKAILNDGQSMGQMMGQQLLLADAQDRVVADSTGTLVGETLTASELALGVAIEADGRQVGTLLARGGMNMGGAMFGQELTNTGRELLARVNRAIWLAALAAGGAALIVGGLLAYGLVRPIQQLTAATSAVARGDLSQRVAAKSKDEIGELAASFNSMADSLQRAEQLRRDMTADIAHELRNPLAVLQSNLEAVIDGILPPMPDTLEPLLDQTHLLSRLVEDLRTLALADAGQLNLSRVPTDPAALVRSVVARFASQAEAEHLALRAEIPASVPTVTLDPQRVEQVLGNLISNAIRHTPEGGSIVCRVTEERGITPRSGSQALVTFTVTDTGSGIPPDALPHIFERFYRVDRSRSHSDGSTGLGLAIAKQLVEAHGGRIWAMSEINQGTAVTFTLPLVTNESKG
jgi:two-component system OmpR family sensor kinase/two-component system sensor histidine kinase BaeS